VKGLDACLRQQSDLVNFGEVVIFTGKPEYRNVLATRSLGGVLRLTDSGGGFEQREQWAAEEADLLACNDGCSAVLETFNVRQDSTAGIEAIGLAHEEVGEMSAV
jgi:hypothetical protein